MRTAGATEANEMLSSRNLGTGHTVRELSLACVQRRLSADAMMVAVAPSTRTPTMRSAHTTGMPAGFSGFHRFGIGSACLGSGPVPGNDHVFLVY